MSTRRYATFQELLAGIADGDIGGGAPGPPGTTDYTQLTNKPTLGSAASHAATDFATSGQGAKADTALQNGGAFDAAGAAAAAAAAISLAGLGGVPTSRKVAGKALTADVALSASDVGADAAGAAAAITLAGLGGGPAGAATTPATTGTQSVPMTSGVKTITPTGACTFNATGGVAGQLVTFIVTTSGTAAFVMTFGTNFKAAGTLSTGTVTAKVFCVTFRCKDGTLWVETGRTAAM